MHLLVYELYRYQNARYDKKSYLMLRFQLRGFYSLVWAEKKVTEIQQVNFEEVNCNKRVVKVDVCLEIMRNAFQISLQPGRNPNWEPPECAAVQTISVAC